MKKTMPFFAIALLAGCGATSKLDYFPPVEYKKVNQIEINEEFEVVWSRLVKNLASDFFVINNIEKSSNIINVSFTASDPTRYVDCGSSERSFSNMRGDADYSYDPAGSATYTFTNPQGHVFNANRIGTLSGIANIYVSDEGETTVVNANVKYSVDVKIYYSNVVGNHAGTDNFTVDFSTKNNHTSPDGVICTSIGNLEQMILDYAVKT